MKKNSEQGTVNSEQGTGLVVSIAGCQQTWIANNNPRSLILLIIISVVLVFNACYLTITPVHPSPAAFRQAESPFLNGQQRISGMATDGTNVVAVSYEGTIAFSRDYGENWQTAPLVYNAFSDGIRFNTVTWGEGYFLAGGDFGRAAWSRDGEVWHAGVIGPMSPKNIYALSVGIMKTQLVFVAAGADGRIAYALNSPDGPWIQVLASPFGNKDGEGESVNALVFGRIKGAGIFVAAGDNGNIAVMNDFSGKFSGPSAAGTRETLRGLGFGDDRFIVVGDSAVMKISADPESYSWTTIRERDFGLRPFLNIDYYPLMEFFVLIAEDSAVGFSKNGESWSATTFASHFTNGISAIACTRKKIVLGGADGVIVYSN